MGIKKGLGDTSEFAAFHPFVNLVFFAFAIGIAMFSTRPVFVAVSFVCSWCYSILLGGGRAVKVNIVFMLPAVIVMAFINTFFTHDGETVLFYINGNRITMEALAYGIVSALVLTSVIVWFTAFNKVMSSDKFIYLFGKAAPVLGLTLSMIFRFIPLLKSRFAEISMGQKCMGRGMSGNPLKKIRLLLKEVSILISWSLEASIETADSMEARGYGLRGRTSFHLFKFTRRDMLVMVTVALLGGISAVGCILGRTSIYYYPVITHRPFDILTAVSLAAYTAMLIVPMIIDVKGEREWKQLNLQM